MRPPRHTANDREPDTLRMPAPYAPDAEPEARLDSPERRDSYLTWLVLGLVSPFVLALPLYPLLWLPVSAVAVPVAGALWAVLAAIFGLFAPAGAGASSQDGAGILGPAFWDFGPLISPTVALTSVAAVTVAWFVLSRVVGKRRWWHAEGTAKRGFRAGLRISLLAIFLLAVWWANRTLLAGA